ncbi:MAG TPA: glycosyltransferase family 2 protein, partial [Rubellimicrobium sp.]|nr:glycosyltransferase family 2 protein [Rubellimicrobium sp.]
MTETADPRPAPSGGKPRRQPLRAVARMAASAIGRTWLPVNRLARDQYRALKSRNPALAEGLRTALWPVLRLGNRYLLGISYIPMTAYYKSGQALHYQRPLPPGDFAPLVTVIVPNYNHAPYLRQRLDSIYGQTYANVEVLLMDDCSSDDSRAILSEYRDRYPDRSRLLFNEANSGGVFFQWEKGLREARGELVWIAESDDWADLNLLETLVPFFKNPAVMLSYARTEFMSGDGLTPVWSMDHYLSDVGGDRWRRAWIETAPDIVREAFAQKNIIPNVSSAVFRKVDRLDVLGIDRWRGMKTSGDWMFYLNLLRGGLLAYSPGARNYFRQHQRNTSVGSYSTERYYREHEEVAKETARLYGVHEERLARQRQDLIHHWKANRPEWDEAAFAACYDVAAIREAGAARKPNV